MSSIMDCDSGESGELEFSSSADEFASSSELEEIVTQPEPRAKPALYKIIDSEAVTKLQV